MTRGRNLIPYGPLYLLREKGQYPSFTLGPDPEFVFTLFACVGLNAAKIHRAINRRVSVQMSSPHFKNPVDGEPEWISLSNQLMKEYHMTKAAKYREVVILLELGFLEEYLLYPFLFIFGRKNHIISFDGFNKFKSDEKKF